MDLPRDAREIYPGEGYYATPDGRIFSTRYKKGHETREMSYRLANSGYLFCTFMRNGKSTLQYVHRLVAQTFLPNPDNKQQVDHINLDKMNNTVENLEWVTQSENCSRYREHIVENETTTSGRHGTLFHETTPIRRFRSLQQAKLFCKKEYGCSLSTVGSTNINKKNHLFYIRDSAKIDIRDVWKNFVGEQAQIRQDTIANIKKTRGTSGKLYKDSFYVADFASVREANEAIHHDLKKRGNKYIATGGYVFIIESDNEHLRCNDYSRKGSTPENELLAEAR